MPVTDIYILQHGEKAPESGDPPLTARGVCQATMTGAYLRDKAVACIVSSPLRRTRETAECLAMQLEVEVRFDTRLRERMNWDGNEAGLSLARFLADWARATHERDFVPSSGDSSRYAGQRFERALEDICAQWRGQSVVLVSHGGVTIDALRNLFGDQSLQRLVPSLIASGMPSGGLTHVRRSRGEYRLVMLASVDHLPEPMRTSHRKI